MLIQRSKPIERNITRAFTSDKDIQVAQQTFGALFTPESAMKYVQGLCDWIVQNAWDAETYFWDMAATQKRRLGAADPDLEATCTGMLSAADHAIEEIIHTLSDLCAMEYTYTFAWDDWKTQYAPHVEDLLSMVKEQAKLISTLSENPRYNEMYRRYCGHLGPWHISVDPNYEDRDAGDCAELLAALDNIWAEACALLEELGPNFAPVYTIGYPMATLNGVVPVPDGYKAMIGSDMNSIVMPCLRGTELRFGDMTGYAPAFREVEPGDVVLIERCDYDDSLEDTNMVMFREYLDNSVYAIVIQSDGKIVIGGGFTGYLKRLNPDGTDDLTFVPPTLNGAVRAIALQSDGKIVIGGGFTDYLKRLNTDGSNDSGFAPSLNYTVYAVAIQSDGKIVIGGQFTGFGVPSYLRRLDTNGGYDNTFSPSVDGIVYAIAIQSDGKIVIGGAFTGKLKRLETNGDNDTGFNPTVSSTVRAIAIQSDGKIVLGGVFTGYLKRLETNGDNDTGFSPTVDSSVYAIAIQSDGKIVIGGAFTEKLKRLETDGSADSGFSPSVDNTVYALAIQPDGKILAGGDNDLLYFAEPDGTTRLVESDVQSESEFGLGFRLRKIRGVA